MIFHVCDLVNEETSHDHYTLYWSGKIRLKSRRGVGESAATRKSTRTSHFFPFFTFFLPSSSASLSLSFFKSKFLVGKMPVCPKRLDTPYLNGRYFHVSNIKVKHTGLKIAGADRRDTVSIFERALLSANRPKDKWLYFFRCLFA